MRSMIRSWLEPIRKNGVLDVPTAIAKGRVCIAADDVGEVRWLITNRNDEIQSAQIEQGYYELAELRQLRMDVGERNTILDVGANIGNHSIYFARHFGCERLIVVEPYRPAIEQLLANIALNYSPCFDLGFLGKAIGAEAGTASIIAPTQFNIGLTRLDPAKPGEVDVVTGDAIIQCSLIDLIKIDVEGMELEVIKGLWSTLQRQRPALFVEVCDHNRDRFLNLMQELNYRIARDNRAYDTQSNFTMIAQ